MNIETREFNSGLSYTFDGYMFIAYFDGDIIASAVVMERDWEDHHILGSNFMRSSTCRLFGEDEVDLFFREIVCGKDTIFW